MHASQVRLNPFRALPVAFALILNVVVGPLGPFVSQIAPDKVLGYVGSTAFELDGNIDHSGTNHDWDQVHTDFLNGNTLLSGADNVEFITDLVDTTADDIFTGGGSKDQQLIQTGPWLWTTSKPQPKDDITHAFAAAYTINGHTIAYFGLDKFEVDGDNQVGFWFFKNGIAKTGVSQQGGFKFSGEHAVGDILVLSDYTNGGTVPAVKVYKWVGSGGSDGSLDLIASPANAKCDNVTNQFVCGITNSAAFTSSAWTYKNRDEAAQTWPAGGLFEGGLDLTHFGLDTGCFSSFLAETRSSQSVTATLSDFALGQFSFCEPPLLATQVSKASGDVGDSFTDTATLSGNKGPVTGTVDFYVCGPTASAQDCASGGTASGLAKPISGGQATSDAFSADAAGFYCVRTVFHPTEGSHYLTTTQTDKTNECFQAKPAAIHVTKTADAATVSAGAPIGFTVTVSNSGTGTAKGVTLSDALPGGNVAHPVHWTIDPVVGNPAAFAISGADGSQQLTLAGQPITLAAGASLTVHVTATTNAGQCATYNNTASVTTTNDSQDSASASTRVLCPSLTISKTPDGGTVVAGSPISFTITVHNGGPGAATNVDIDDVLPAGFAWAENPNLAECAISTGKLHCDLATLAAGADFSVTVSAPTTAEDCGLVPNTAEVDADNSTKRSDDGDVTVLCPDVSIQKGTSTPHVSAGDSVTYTITVTAGGTGNSTNVTVNDTLPTGVAWNAPGGTDGGSCTITSGVLHCTFGAMAPGAQKHVTLTGTAGTGACPSIDNTATVSSDADVDSSNNSAGPVQITVDCPDVSVLKVAKDDPISAGDTAEFDITVTNLGPGTAKDVNLSDTLPTGITWSEDSDFCSITSGTLSCHWDSIAENTGFQIHVTGVTDAADCGQLTNTATVSASNEAQEDLGNNQSTATLDVLCPNLSASKTHDHDPVNAGAQIGFTLTISNSDDEGTGTAHDVALNDPLPAGADLNWSIASQPAGNPCTITGNPGAQTLECSFGDLNPGDSVSVHIVSDTAKADCATYQNVASVTASNHDELNPQASVTVQCPGLNIAKTAADTSVNGGDSVSFTIVVWNTGPGDALNVTLDDPLPGGLNWTDDSADCSITSGNLHCQFGDLGVTTKENSPARVTVSADTTREDCGTLNNTAVAHADNNDDVQASASIDVTCPVISISKDNDTDGPVLPGTLVTYTLTVTVSDGPANDVTVVDTLPDGLDDPTNISDGGTWSSADRTITWQFASLADGDKVLTYKAAVSLTDENGDELTNVAIVTSPNTQCPNAEQLGDECKDTSTVPVRVPTLVIEKAADRHVIDVSAGKDTTVTWTLTHTLTNGPVTNAVITDPIPGGLSYVAGSASNGGVYDPNSRTLTWTFATLSASGTVSFKTTVDSNIGGGVSFTNVATIKSNETPADTGQDTIRTTEAPPPQAATPTPRPSVPNTAMVPGQNGQPIQIPIEFLVIFFIGSLGALTLANVKAVRRRR
jgi:uncharacterized repeat protein (TIGR01451 family)/fimbrial isopeptide formation D2 family protein